MGDAERAPPPPTGSYADAATRETPPGTPPKAQRNLFRTPPASPRRSNPTTPEGCEEQGWTMLGPKIGGGGGRRGLSSPSSHILVLSIITLALPTTSAAASTAAGASPAPSPLASCPSLLAFAPLAPPAWCPRVLAPTDSFVGATAPSVHAFTLAFPVAIATTVAVATSTIFLASRRPGAIRWQPAVAQPVDRWRTLTRRLTAATSIQSTVRGWLVRHRAACAIQAVARGGPVRRTVRELRVLCASQTAAAMCGIDILAGRPPWAPGPAAGRLLVGGAGVYFIGSPSLGTAAIRTLLGWYSVDTDLCFSVECRTPFRLAVRELNCDGEQGTDVTPYRLRDATLTLQVAVRSWVLRRVAAASAIQACVRGFFVRRCTGFRGLDCTGLRLVRVRDDPGYPIDLIFVNSSTNLLHAEELASSGTLKHSPNPGQYMPEAKRPAAAAAPESPVRCAKASATKASGGARRAGRKKKREEHRRAAVRSLTAADAAGATRGALVEVRGVWYRYRSRAYRRAEREDSLRDRRWQIYRRDPRVDALIARHTAADTIRCAYKTYAARQAWWRSDEFAILSRPRATPCDWKAEDGLLVPVYENSDEERMENERGALVWQLQTHGGILPNPGASALHTVDPCLDPIMEGSEPSDSESLDLGSLDPDTADYGQPYPDGHDDVTTGAA